MRLTGIAYYCRNFGGLCPSEVNIRAHMRPKFNLRLERGHGFSRFQRQAECRLRCLPSQKGRLFVTAATFSLPIVFVLYPYTRSTLRENRFQRERWGSYTIFTLRTAFSGLSARVSDNQSLHGYCYSYYCKEKKAHSLYYL